MFMRKVSPTLDTGLASGAATSIPEPSISTCMLGSQTMRNTSAQLALTVRVADIRCVSLMIGTLPAAAMRTLVVVPAAETGEGGLHDTALKRALDVAVTEALGSLNGGKQADGVADRSGGQRRWVISVALHAVPAHPVERHKQPERTE